MKFFAVFAAIVAVAIAKPFGTSWSLQELSEALQNPQLNPALVPVLEHALDQLMDALYNGQQVESIHVPLPADVPLYPGDTAVAPSPVAPSPVGPPPVGPSPVGPSSPLVQIIINVKGQEQVVDVPLPMPEDDAAPEPVIVVPVVVPEETAPGPVNPIDVIAVNPIDSWGPAGFSPVEHEDVGPL